MVFNTSTRIVMSKSEGFELSKASNLHGECSGNDMKICAICNMWGFSD